MSSESLEQQSFAAGVLRSLVTRFPTAMIDDADFAESALRDLLGDAQRRERTLLVAAARAGVPAQLRDGTFAASASAGGTSIPGDALWAVEAWRVALGDIAPNATSAPLEAPSEDVPLVASLTQPLTTKPKPVRPGGIGPVAFWIGTAVVAVVIGFFAFRPHSTPGDGVVAVASPSPEPSATIDYLTLVTSPSPTPLALATVAPRARATVGPHHTSPFDILFGTASPSQKHTPSPRPSRGFDQDTLFGTTTVRRTPTPTLPPRTEYSAPPARSIAQARPVQTSAPERGSSVPVRSFGYAPGGDLSDPSQDLSECIGAWRSQDWTAAKAACARAASAAPNDPEPELLLGESYYGCHCYDGAIAPLSRVLDLPSTPSQKLEAYRYRGFVDYELYNRYGDSKDLEWAFYDFGGALDIDDRDPTTLFDYGSSAYTLHRWCAAQRAFGTLAMRYPNDRESAYWRDEAAANANEYGCS